MKKTGIKFRSLPVSINGIDLKKKLNVGGQHSPVRDSMVKVKIALSNERCKGWNAE